MISLNLKKRASFGKLLVSIGIDLVGMGSYVIPGIGEISDTIWGPISGVLIYGLYKQPVSAIVGFGEEFSPGFDIIPTATLAWFIEKFNFRL